MIVPKTQEVLKGCAFSGAKTLETLKVALRNSWTCPRTPEMWKMLKMLNFNTSRVLGCVHDFRGAAFNISML